MERVKEEYKALSQYIISILYHDWKQDKKRGTYDFFGEQQDRQKYNALESEGYIIWDDGWVPDYNYPAVFL